MMLPLSHRKKKRALRLPKTNFTLVELLIVVGIIVILTSVVILTLNPAELIRQSRDGERVADMNTLNSALGIYLANVPKPNLGNLQTVYVSLVDLMATTTAGTDCSSMGLPAMGSGFVYHCAASSTFRSAEGDGWIPVDLTQIAGKSPLSTLPVDPINTPASGLYYTYQVSANDSWELTSVMESNKYGPNGSNNLPGNDGGMYPDLYEAGTTHALLPVDRLAVASSTSSSPDTTAPTVPTNLAATAASASQVNLSWTASTDIDNSPNQLFYTIYRNGIFIATTTAGSTSYNDAGLIASTNYTYTISASDLANNISTQTASVSTSTLASTGNFLWSSILASNRAVDWSHAGADALDGVIPSASWTQCGSTIAPYGDAGIADISGSTLTWRAGTPFGSTSPSWVGGTIMVGGTSYTIASVNSPTSITLTSASPIPVTGRGFVGPNVGNVSTINNRIAGCGANTYVQLGAGYFGLNGGITAGSRSNVEIRGMGADQTQLIFSANNGCLGAWSDICFASADLNYKNSPTNLVNWTAGYAKGTTNITLASVPNLKVGNPIILDQLDDDITADTGAVFVCQDQTSKCSISGNVGNAPRTNRDQMQIVTVTSCNGVTTQGAACSGANVSVGISPGLYMPNWRASQTPQAWWSTSPIENVGVQNLSIDNSNVSGTSGIAFFNALNGWVRGVRSIDTGYSHVFLELSARITVRDSYFYLTQNSVNSSYAVNCFGSSDDLIENNIFHAISGPVLADSACSGSVVGYNYSINDFNSLGPGWINAFSNPHTAGVDSMLYEGNVAPQIYLDNFHGTRNLLTMYRNYLWGTEPTCFSSWTGGATGSGKYYPEDTAWQACNNPLIPIILRSYSRIMNVVGNVLGTPSVQSTYQGTYSNNEIYDLGYNDMTGTTDANTALTLMRWGNYDTVNNTTRFSAAEVPSSLAGAQAPFSNPVPANNSLPASFYESSKPFWWPVATPWPAIGPDVSGGNILRCTSGPYNRGYAVSAAQCSGTSATAGNGMAYSIPAMNCYLNVMGGPPDGTGGVLSFNADACY